MEQTTIPGNALIDEDVDGRGRDGLLWQRKFTIPQAAGMLGMGQTKLRAMLRAGRMPVLELDGRILLLESDLEAFLRSRHGGLKVAANRPLKAISPLPTRVLESGLLKRRN